MSAEGWCCPKSLGANFGRQSAGSLGCLIGHLFELPGNLLSIPGPLEESLRVPLASAWRGEKIAAVHVDGGGQPGNRIDHRMDNVTAERLGIPFAQRLRAYRFQFTALARGNAAPEDIVLAPSVDADDSPHLMVVGRAYQIRCPDDVHDGEVIRAAKRLKYTALGFA